MRPWLAGSRDPNAWLEMPGRGRWLSFADTIRRERLGACRSVGPSVTGLAFALNRDTYIGMQPFTLRLRPPLGITRRGGGARLLLVSHRELSENRSHRFTSGQLLLTNVRIGLQLLLSAISSSLVSEGFSLSS